jgi:hypothetical protein
MSSYNLVYRGGKQQPGIRNGALAIARASRSRQAQLPKNSPQSHKENKPPEELARRRLDSGESNKALERVVIAAEERAESNRQAQAEQHQKEKEENDRLAKIPQQTDLAWPSSKGATKDALKDQLKEYRRLLGNPDFLGNISGNKERLIEQYNKAVEGWIDKQKEQEARQCHAAHS